MAGFWKEEEEDERRGVGWKMVERSIVYVVMNKRIEIHAKRMSKSHKMMNWTEKNRISLCDLCIHRDSLANKTNGSSNFIYSYLNFSSYNLMSSLFASELG